MGKEREGIVGFFKSLGEYYRAEDVNDDGEKRKQEIQSSRASYPTEYAARFEEEAVKGNTKIRTAVYGFARKIEIIPAARGLEKVVKGTTRGVTAGLKNLFHRSDQETPK